MKKSNNKETIKKNRIFFVKLSNHVWLQLFVLTLSIIVLSFITFGQVLQFGFWRDDWAFLWAAQHHPNLSLPWSFHLGTKYEDILLIKFFGWNSTLWQKFGIFLRITASLTLALMLRGFTCSKRIAVLAGLFFAVSFVGLETVSWQSVHVVAIDIILICTGFYFLSQYRILNNRKYFIEALLFLLTAVLADSLRSIPIIILLFTYLFITWYIKPNSSLKQLPRIVIDTGLSGIILLTLAYLCSLNTEKARTLKLVMQDILNPEKYMNIFASIGNMLLGWIKNIFEQGSLSNYDSGNAFFGLIFLLVASFISIFYLLKKKSRNAGYILFFILWLILFYIPNWLFDKNLVLAGTHRYIGISGVAVIAILAILIGSIRSFKIVVSLSFIFIMLNIMTSHRILKNESIYRNKTVVEKIWNKVDADVPKNEKNSIFIYLGGDITKGYVMDWSGSVPFGVKRELIDQEDFPIANVDYNLIVNLLCSTNVRRPAVSQWMIQKTKIPLSHVHAWEVNNGEIVNESQRERKIIQDLAKTQKCTIINS